MIININTINESKVLEVKHIFKNENEIKINFLKYDIREILSNDIETVIRHKVITAYTYWKKPVIVEHGALEINYFNKFPGALSKPMWDLMGEKICTCIPNGQSKDATVISAVAYCDGKIIRSFIYKTPGSLSNKSLGNNGFQFDPIFIPNGSNKTYAEMDLKDKMVLSQATRSYGELIKFLKSI